MLTGRELEFLVSLSASWWQLYACELARLFKAEDTPCGARHDARSTASPANCLPSRQTGRGTIVSFNKTRSA